MPNAKKKRQAKNEDFKACSECNAAFDFTDRVHIYTEKEAQGWQKEGVARQLYRHHVQIKK